MGGRREGGVRTQLRGVGGEGRKREGWGIEGTHAGGRAGRGEGRSVGERVRGGRTHGERGGVTGEQKGETTQVGTKGRDRGKQGEIGTRWREESDRRGGVENGRAAEPRRWILESASTIRVRVAFSI
eukprot:1639283-Rhodomonas_salina.1